MRSSRVSRPLIPLILGPESFVHGAHFDPEQTLLMTPDKIAGIVDGARGILRGVPSPRRNFMLRSGTPTPPRERRLRSWRPRGATVRVPSGASRGPERAHQVPARAREPRPAPDRRSNSHALRPP